MSKLASTLRESEPVYRSSGPRCGGFFLYKDLDKEDYEAISEMKMRGFSWAEIQKLVDEQLNISDPISVRRFTYHISNQCTCALGGSK